MIEAFKFAGLILGAGLSTRYGSSNKLLKELDGIPMICRVVQLAKKASLNPCLVITGHEADLLNKKLVKENIKTLHNKSYRLGMGSSISCGITALKPLMIDGVVILLGDMPNVDPKSIVSLYNGFNPKLERDICIPVESGKMGNPVLFGRSHFKALMEVHGDQGGKKVIQSNQNRVSYINTDDKGIHFDYDTLDD